MSSNIETMLAAILAGQNTMNESIVALTATQETFGKRLLALEDAALSAPSIGAQAPAKEEPQVEEEKEKKPNKVKDGTYRQARLDRRAANPTTAHGMTAKEKSDLYAAKKIGKIADPAKRAAAWTKAVTEYKKAN